MKADGQKKIASSEVIWPRPNISLNFFHARVKTVSWATLILFIEKLVFNFRAEFITMKITHKILLQLAVLTGEKICIN